MRTRSQSREQRPPPPEGTPVVIEPLRIEYPFQEDPTVEPMADTRTMAQLLQAPPRGRCHTMDSQNCINLIPFYNAFDINDQDSLNSAAGRKFLAKCSENGLKIIESKILTSIALRQEETSLCSSSAPAACQKQLISGSQYPEVTKERCPPANYGSTEDVKPPVVQIQSRYPVLECGHSIPYYDLIVCYFFSTLTPFGASDFLLLEEADFPWSRDGSGFEPHFPLQVKETYSPDVRTELKVCEIIRNSSIDEPTEVESLRNCLPISGVYAFLEGTKVCLSLLLRVGFWYQPGILYHKILMEEDYAPAVTSRRVKSKKPTDVIKTELNEATRKGPLPTTFNGPNAWGALAGNEYYCFLDGSTGYFQIPFDPSGSRKGY
ncbi:hypothetical protein Tco_1083092 [Tanacetum coccineum]|uniref:Uncharacterized protein n=1 Tax=Tanacetum coccineum TaxID=301880 RepID=A0ABQ5I293_9ASTR